jgi:hypothetical protein
MKLGEMLVRDGHIDSGQVDAAVMKQGADGGRFGTVLVELGFIDLETLTVYLGLELGLPIATGAMLERAKRTAVRLLTPEQAHRFRCVPLLISDRQLIAAVDDPHDMVALDELGRLTGYRIIPRVAPEVRIFYYLERFYGVARPERFRRFGDLARGNRKPAVSVAGRMPGPSLPGLPPVADRPVSAPTPAPVLRARPRTEPSREVGPEPGGSARDELEADAASLVIELEADAAETAEQAPPTEALEAIESSGRYDGAAAVAEFERETTTSVERRELFVPQSLEASLHAMAEASQRGEIADALMCHARELFDVGCLLIVRDHLAFGWKGFGRELVPDRLEALLIPLDAASIFHAALHEEGGVFAGMTFPSVIHRHFYKVLRCAPPKQAVVAVVRIGRRAVNLIYGHKAGATASADHEVDGLRRLVVAAADAYVRLIAIAKAPEDRADRDRDG